MKTKIIKKKLNQIKMGGRLAARVWNPKSFVKMVGNAVKGKGLIFPGSKYIGPGNTMNLGKPKTKADALAYQHDVDYDDYQKSKKISNAKMYLGYSDADKRIRKEARKIKTKDPGALALYAGLSLKKRASKAGLTGKRTRDKDVYGPTGKPATVNEHQDKATQYLKEAY